MPITGASLPLTWPQNVQISLFFGISIHPKLPFLFCPASVINKIDVPGADVERVIGEITSGQRVFVRKSGKKEELKPVAVDPFWAAYFSVLEEKNA
jgi:hypothetical protein